MGTPLGVGCGEWDDRGVPVAATDRVRRGEGEPLAEAHAVDEAVERGQAVAALLVDGEKDAEGETLLLTVTVHVCEGAPDTVGLEEPRAEALGEGDKETEADAERETEEQGDAVALRVPPPGEPLAAPLALGCAEPVCVAEPLGERLLQPVGDAEYVAHADPQALKLSMGEALNVAAASVPLPCGENEAVEEGEGSAVVLGAPELLRCAESVAKLLALPTAL